MNKARTIQQLVITAPNEVGTLAKLCAVIRAAGANISHFCGSALGDDARLMVAVDNIDQVSKDLQALDYEVSQTEVLEVQLGNEPGTLEPLARALADAGVDIEYSYATTSNGQNVTCIMTTNDNAKALSLINGG